MKHLPVRTSLVAQVVDLARRNIRSGLWRGHLPGQRALADELQVSRPTLQLAMDILRKEGVISGEPGRRLRIVRRPRASRSASRPEAVGFLSPVPLENLTALSLYLLSDLQRHLAGAGLHLEIHTEKRFAVRRPSVALDRLVRETRATAWVLHVASPEIQRWFARERIPAILSKVSHPGVTLPSFDIDYAAVGRHAGGLLRSLGHLQVLLVRSPTESAGQQQLEEGLRQAMSFEREGGKASLHVVAPPTSAEGAHPLASALARPVRPTAVALADAATASSCLAAFAASGLRVPRDLSVLCAFDDPLLPFLRPGVARYHVNWASYSRRFARMVIHLARTGTLPPRQTFVMPEFVKGDTLGPAPSAANEKR